MKTMTRDQNRESKSAGNSAGFIPSTCRVLKQILNTSLKCHNGGIRNPKIEPVQGSKMPFLRHLGALVVIFGISAKCPAQRRGQELPKPSLKAVSEKVDNLSRTLEISVLSFVWDLEKNGKQQCGGGAACPRSSTHNRVQWTV